MTEEDKSQKEGKRKKKFLWFGYGNYGGNPNPQIGGGFIRDPGLLEETLKDTKEERPSVKTYLVNFAMALIGLIILALLATWILSAVMR